VGDEGAPRFEPPVALVPKHEGIGYSEPLEPGQVPKPGIRSQIAVADHDGDGKLDLLLGDFCTYLELRDDLTAEQVAEFRRLYAQDLEDAKYLRGEMERTRAEYRERMEATGLPEAEWGEKGQEVWKELYEAMKAAPEYVARSKAVEASSEKLARFAKKGPQGSQLGNGPDVAHGFVWLFPRRGPWAGCHRT
jgi:hypothetical protein